MTSKFSLGIRGSSKAGIIGICHPVVTVLPFLKRCNQRHLDIFKYSYVERGKTEQTTWLFKLDVSKIEFVKKAVFENKMR